MARRQARWSTAARRRFSQAATKGDKAGESTSTPTKWYVAGGVLAVAAPSYVVVSSLQSDPEMREQVQINYPDFYEFLHGVVPGGLEVVTYASIRASKSDWLEAHELPWGEGYDEDIPNVRATVITKRGSRYTGVDLCATDSAKSIIAKIVPLGAQIDDEVIDVKFEETGDANFGQANVEAMVGLTENMTPAQLAEAVEFLQRQKVECEIQQATWQSKGTVGKIKAQEMANRAQVFDREINRIKALM